MDSNMWRHWRLRRRTSLKERPSLSALILLSWVVFQQVCYAAKPIPTVEVQVVRKETAHLPCDISLPDPRADDVILVLWYREDLGRPIYSVDARDRSFQDAERWSDENVFGNRAYFRSSGRPAILAIENVQETDAAIYRCRVDFRVAQTRNAKVNLTVIVPPNHPTIHDEAGKERNNLVGPYTEGSSLVLTCKVSGGDPQPRVIWYRNGKIIDTSDYFDDDEGVMKNELRVSILARSDLHADLSCETLNNNISTPLMTTVHVDMNFAPISVALKNKSPQLTAGKTYDLFCKSVGSRPPAVITWYLDGQRVEAGNEFTTPDGNSTESTVTLVPKKQDSGKNLTCRARNSIIPSITLEDSFTLQVFYAPETQIRLGHNLKANTIWEGADLYFECIIDANPPVHKVDWRHNGKILSHSKNSGVLISNHSLVLQRVTRMAAGNYTCIGRNTGGEGESQPFYLDILYAPTCRPNQNRIHGVAKLENANISCEVDANPPMVKFRWTFNNSAESTEVPTGRYKSAGTRSMVTYTPMSELDYGTLLCWASNTIGEQRVPCAYHVIAAGRPDIVHNCTLANHSTDSFFLQCIEGFNGGLPQSFILELYDSQTNKLRANMSTSVPMFSVTGLEPGLSFTAHVSAFNNKGRSEPSIVSVFTLRLPEKIQTRVDKDPRLNPFEFARHYKISIPIAVGGGLVILSLLVLTVRVYCSRKRTRKERRRREKTVTTPLKIMDPPDGCDSDEKNPDVIPLDSDEVEYYRKRQQHISTIDASSPARVTAGGLPTSYCTLRNGGIPLQDLNNLGTRPKYSLVTATHETGSYGTVAGMSGGSGGVAAAAAYVGGCGTLPRGHHHGGGGHHQSMELTSGHHMSLEWPSYQGGAGIGPRRYAAAGSAGAAVVVDAAAGTSLLSHNTMQAQHQQHQHNLQSTLQRGHMSSFRPQIGPTSCTELPGGANLPYDLPPPPMCPAGQERLLHHHHHQQQQQQDDDDMTDVPLMTDKIESTV